MLELGAMARLTSSGDGNNGQNGWISKLKEVKIHRILMNKGVWGGLSVEGKEQWGSLSLTCHILIQ